MRVSQKRKACFGLLSSRSPCSLTTFTYWFSLALETVTTWDRKFIFQKCLPTLLPWRGMWNVIQHSVGFAGPHTIAQLWHMTCFSLLLWKILRSSLCPNFSEILLLYPLCGYFPFIVLDSHWALSSWKKSTSVDTFLHHFSINLYLL